VRTPARAGRV
jgi:hypothetical protein